MLWVGYLPGRLSLTGRAAWGSERGGKRGKGRLNERERETQSNKLTNRPIKGQQINKDYDRHKIRNMGARRSSTNGDKETRKEQGLRQTFRQTDI